MSFVALAGNLCRSHNLVKILVSSMGLLSSVQGRLLSCANKSQTKAWPQPKPSGPRQYLVSSSSSSRGAKCTCTLRPLPDMRLCSWQRSSGGAQSYVRMWPVTGWGVSAYSHGSALPPCRTPASLSCKMMAPYRDRQPRTQRQPQDSARCNVPNVRQKSLSARPGGSLA